MEVRIIQLSLWLRVLKQTARNLVIPLVHKSLCESRRHRLFSGQSTQQQEQYAGSSGVKTLSPNLVPSTQFDREEWGGNPAGTGIIEVLRRAQRLAQRLQGRAQAHPKAARPAARQAGQPSSAGPTLRTGPGRDPVGSGRGSAGRNATPSPTLRAAHGPCLCPSAAGPSGAPPSESAHDSMVQVLNDF